MSEHNMFFNFPFADFPLWIIPALILLEFIISDQKYLPFQRNILDTISVKCSYSTSLCRIISIPLTGNPLRVSGNETGKAHGRFSVLTSHYNREHRSEPPFTPSRNLPPFTPHLIRPPRAYHRRTSSRDGSACVLKSRRHCCHITLLGWIQPRRA